MVLNQKYLANTIRAYCLPSYWNNNLPQIPTQIPSQIPTQILSQILTQYWASCLGTEHTSRSIVIYVQSTLCNPHCVSTKFRLFRLFRLFRFAHLIKLQAETPKKRLHRFLIQTLAGLQVSILIDQRSLENPPLATERSHHVPPLIAATDYTFATRKPIHFIDHKVGSERAPNFSRCV